MQKRSKLEIEKWTKILDKNFSKGYGSASERLCAYVCSLTIGRGFSETIEAYFERKGLTEFVGWAKDR